MGFISSFKKGISKGREEIEEKRHYKEAKKYLARKEREEREAREAPSRAGLVVGKVAERTRPAREKAGSIAGKAAIKTAPIIRSAGHSIKGAIVAGGKAYIKEVQRNTRPRRAPARRAPPRRAAPRRAAPRRAAPKRRKSKRDPWDLGIRI